MSRIYFHAEGAEAEVLGSERAWLSQLTQRVAGGIFALATYEQMLALLPADHYVRAQPGGPDGPALRNAFQLFLGGFMNDCFSDGESVFRVVLNTTLAAGNDTLRLAARLHGQCELHAYVAGEDCEWLAHLITEGRARSILRQGQGWESVVELLRSDPGHVVTSYSVCESFPNAEVAAWSPQQDEGGHVSDEAWDAWYDLSENERWRLGLEGVRKEPTLRLDPVTWERVCFGAGKNAFDYLAEAA